MTRQRMFSVVKSRWPVEEIQLHSVALCHTSLESSMREALTVGINRAVALAMPPPNSASRSMAAAGTGRMMSTEELRRLIRRTVDSGDIMAVSLPAPATQHVVVLRASATAALSVSKHSNHGRCF